MLDLSPYDGFARTRYTLDASCVTSATLATLKTTTGSGAVSLGALTAPGGRITLSTTTTTDTAAVVMPYSWGSVGGTVVAWAVEVAGLQTNGVRGTVELGFLSTNGAARTGIFWNDSGAGLSSTDTPQAVYMQSGSFKTMSDMSAGVLVDMSGGSSATATAVGDLGGTQVSQGPGVAAAGLYTALLKSTGTSSSASISFRQLALTLVWRTPGTVTEKVL